MTSQAYSSPGILSDPVARYYDENTSRFLRLGGGGEAAAIHRKIWAPGVKKAQEAFIYLNRLVALEVALVLPQPPAQARLLDLGCGVGGTSTWVAQELGVQVVGVSNSTTQVSLARDRLGWLGLEGQCSFVQADFHHLPNLGVFHAAYAIESFTHSSDPVRFFEQAASSLVPGGRLVICDDYLADVESKAVWIERFKQGWHLGSLLPVETVASLAQVAGLRLAKAQDLTPYLRVSPSARLALMKVLTRLPIRNAYWQNLSGGTALQVCLVQGWTQYWVLTFVKQYLE